MSRGISQNSADTNVPITAKGDGGITMVIGSFSPGDAPIPVWTGRLLCFPIDGTFDSIRAVPRFGLPLLLSADRPERHHRMRLAALHYSSGIHRAFIDHRGVRSCRASGYNAFALSCFHDMLLSPSSFDVRSIA